MLSGVPGDDEDHRDEYHQRADESCWLPCWTIDHFVRPRATNRRTASGRLGVSS